MVLKFWGWWVLLVHCVTIIYPPALTIGDSIIVILKGLEGFSC
jgi:hypothetical protein